MSLTSIQSSDSLPGICFHQQSHMHPTLNSQSREHVRTSCGLARKKKKRIFFFPPKRAALIQSRRNSTDISKCRFGPLEFISGPSDRSGTHISAFCQIQINKTICSYCTCKPGCHSRQANTSWLFLALSALSQERIFSSLPLESITHTPAIPAEHTGMLQWFQGSSEAYWGTGQTGALQQCHSPVAVVHSCEVLRSMSTEENVCKMESWDSFSLPS